MAHDVTLEREARKGPKHNLGFGPFRSPRSLQGDRNRLTDRPYDSASARLRLEDLEPERREAAQREGVRPVRARNSVTRWDWSL